MSQFSIVAGPEEVVEFYRLVNNVRRHASRILASASMVKDECGHGEAIKREVLEILVTLEFLQEDLDDSERLTADVPPLALAR